MRTVGVLVNATGDPYSLRLMQAVAHEVVQQGAHAVCFMGGFPQSPLYRDASDRTRLPAMVDGWVVLSETLKASSAGLATLVENRPPCVSVGLELSGTPSLTASDETGILQAVAHLARRHDRKRIAFVAGPITQDDALRRLNAYRMALETVGLSADPALVASGDYETNSGREAVHQLERQAKRFDAVVAANDLMAIGVIDALRSAGRRVPEDVSVIGFDDMEEASFSLPALTTVRQPLQEVGAMAARSVLQQIQGVEVAAREMVTAPLVIRESCGCRADSDRPDRRPPRPGATPGDTQALREGALRDLVRRELAGARCLRELARLGERMLSASDPVELAPLLSDACRMLNVRRFALATYSSAQRHARVTLESSGNIVVFNQHTEAYSLDRVLPPGFVRNDKPTQIGILPLELGEERLGYMLLEGDGRDAHGVLELRRSLTASLARMAHARELRRLYAVDKKRG